MGSIRLFLVIAVLLFSVNVQAHYICNPIHSSEEESDFDTKEKCEAAEKQWLLHGVTEDGHKHENKDENKDDIYHQHHDLEWHRHNSSHNDFHPLHTDPGSRQAHIGSGVSTGKDSGKPVISPDDKSVHLPTEKDTTPPPTSEPEPEPDPPLPEPELITLPPDPTPIIPQPEAPTSTPQPETPRPEPPRPEPPRPEPPRPEPPRPEPPRPEPPRQPETPIEPKPPTTPKPIEQPDIIEDPLPPPVYKEYVEYQFNKGLTFVSIAVSVYDIQTVADLWDRYSAFSAFSGSLFVFVDGDWLAYTGQVDEVVGEMPLTAYTGIAVHLVDSSSLIGMYGVPFPRVETLELLSGVSFIGFPELPEGVVRPSDLLALGAVVVLVEQEGVVYTIGRVGDPGDVPLRVNQGLIVIAKDSITLDFPTAIQASAAVSDER